MGKWTVFMVLEANPHGRTTNMVPTSIFFYMFPLEHQLTDDCQVVIVSERVT
jgi:hypothetical protein